VVVPKVACSTERGALKVASQALGGTGGAVDKLADLDPFRSPLDRVVRSQSPIVDSKEASRLGRPK
jgi:thymidine phosphorylase